MSLSQSLPSVLSPAVSIEFLPGERPAVRSVELAQHFGVSHKNVLRDIRDLMSKLPASFNRLNFEPVTYRDEKGEERPCFLLTRDAFTLLVMGWSSPRAMEWKLKYIEAFNSLERAALENARAEAMAAGARAALSVSQERLQLLAKAVRYHSMGLTQPEIGKLLGVGRSGVNHILRQARSLGLGAFSDWMRPRAEGA